MRRLSLTGLVRPHWPSLLLASAAMLVQGITALLEPWPLMIIVDYVLLSKTAPSWLASWSAGDQMRLLSGAVTAAVVIVVINMTSAFAHRYFAAAAGRLAGDELRRRLYHHVQRLSLTAYGQRQTGDVAARLTDDIAAAEAFIASLPGIALDVITIAGMCAILSYGAPLAAGGLSTGLVVVLVIYLGRMYGLTKHLSALPAAWSKTAIGFEHIRDVLGDDIKIRNRRATIAAPRFVGRIELDGVEFGFSQEQSVLDHLNLRVAAGERVALVGAAGSGTSTLMCLISRLYDPRHGRVLIDGRDIRDFTLESFRRQVSFVMQDTLLFRASVARNIACGRPDATEDQIFRAARLARADEFIRTLPDGYNTLLGEGGQALSRSERQRVAIARALIRDSPIVLLDESPAPADGESEAEIFEAMNTLMAGRTSLVIAHRLATVQSADEIFVLDQGRIVESGSHRALLAANGGYARFYRTRFAPGLSLAS